MVGLGLQHEGEVELKRGLIAAHDEQVRIATGVDAEHGAHAGRILLVQLQSILTADIVVDAGPLHHKAGGVDQQIQRVHPPFEHRPLLVDLGDALAVGMDEMDLRKVERRQIDVVIGRPFAAMHVPRL